MEDRLRAGVLAAALSQAGPALRNVAQLLAGYRQDLIDAGLDRDDALELCIELQREIIIGYEPG